MRYQTRLLALPMSYSSHEFALVHLFHAQNALDTFKNHPRTSISDILNRDIKLNKKGKIQVNTLYDYIYRKESLNHLNWYDFVSFLSKTNELKHVAFPFNDDHKQNATHGMCLRPKQMIPNVLGDLPRFAPVENSTDVEITKYESSMCLLFQLFRDFSQLSYHDLLRSAKPQTKQMISNIELLHKSKDEAERKRLETELHESLTIIPAELNDEFVQ
jgi:hypothetical protein